MKKAIADDNIISARPAKRFFVEMLTRDIELEDAILDLLDNCLDGAVRSNALAKKSANAKEPYKGYWAKITLDENHFRIEDNCGGIPLNLAKNYAFRFGRPDSGRDEKLNTVGVYGIGMKRALFKLGKDSSVSSNHTEGSFGVHIDSDWIENDRNDAWDLEMDRSVKGPKDHGVIIEVKDLHEHIQFQFDKIKGLFEDALKKKVREHYAYIIKKGFKVTINGTNIDPAQHVTLVAETKKGNIAPYLYKTTVNGVNVSLVMGMYERFPSDSELDEMADGKRTKHAAGWTIVCNDRIVLANDITHVTGWGEAGVPNYHSQFVMLSGMVDFSCNDAKKLPLTTTKRGVDLSSPLYADVKNIMRDALKHFTNFTNQWKGHSTERDSVQSTTQAVDIREAALQIPQSMWKEVRVGLKGTRYVPELPKPVGESANARIVFSKDKADVQLVQGYLFDSDDTPKPSDVGKAAFDWVLRKARK